SAFALGVAGHLGCRDAAAPPPVTAPIVAPAPAAAPTAVAGEPAAPAPHTTPAPTPARPPAAAPTAVAAEPAAHAPDRTEPLADQRGFARTRGGAGGTVLRVTTLAADGPGSLAQALAA